MSIKLQIGWPLEVLPNIDGFLFRGVEENGNLTPCAVSVTAAGMHYIIREDNGKPYFNSLRGWMQHLSSNLSTPPKESTK